MAKPIEFDDTSNLSPLKSSRGMLSQFEKTLNEDESKWSEAELVAELKG